MERFIGKWFQSDFKINWDHLSWQDLAYDWGLPLLSTQNKVIFPNQEENTSRVTQELNFTVKLPSTKGEIIEKKERLRFTLSKNIPYGCLLGIYSLFDFKIGFKVTNKCYKPYFDEEEITIMNSSLLLEDLHSNKVSFITIEEETTLDLNLLPGEL